MKKIFFILITWMVVLPMNAQTEPEYLMEIGGGIGMTNYLGDFNGNLLKNFQPGAALVLRRLLNPYSGFKLKVMYGKLKGSSKNIETYYHDYQVEPYEFNKSLVDVCVTFEQNLWPYGTGQDYRGAKRLTPYIFCGMGGTYVFGNGKGVFGIGFPVGVGLKYKVADRLNLGLEWGVHFTLSDKFDGVKDPYYVVSSGAFKNTDCFSSLMLTLTYSFMEKCRVCHNQDE